MDEVSDTRPVGSMPRVADKSWTAAGLVALGLTLPSLVTWLYFVALADRPATVRWVAYTGGKSLQFVLPLVWLLVVRRSPGVRRAERPRGVAENLAFGAATVAALFAVYHFWLRTAGYLAAGSPAAEAIFAKVQGFGVSSAGRYVALAAFYAVFHSALEEYYWRWFVFGALRNLTGVPLAIAVSSAGFMLHHVILLGVYFGPASPVTWLFSLGVAIGGVWWAWSYQRTGSLYGPWLSHLLIDAGIFLVGYDLVRHWIA